MKKISPRLMESLPLELIAGNLKTKVVGDGTTMLIERTSPFLDDPDIMCEIIKRSKASSPQIQRYIVVSSHVFDITDSLAISTIEIDLRSKDE